MLLNEIKDDKDIAKFLEEEEASIGVCTLVWMLVEQICQLQIENEKLKKLLDWKKEW